MAIVWLLRKLGVKEKQNHSVVESDAALALPIMLILVVVVILAMLVAVRVEIGK